MHRLLKVTPNPKTPQNSLLDASLYAKEKWSSCTHQNTDIRFPNQEIFTSHSSNPTPGRNLHNKEESQTSSRQKSYPKHSNLNKMKRQRNIQQVKEHDKSPPNQTKEKEYRIMVGKMIQNLETKMELQINSLETRIEKMWEQGPRRNKKESINNK